MNQTHGELNFKGDDKGADEKKHLALIEHFQKVLKKGNTNANSQTLEKQKDVDKRKDGEYQKSDNLKENQKQDLNMTSPSPVKEKNDK